MKVMENQLAAWLPEVRTIAQQAGAAIMQVYSGKYQVDTKSDGSPLTTADRRSHEIVVSGLRKLTPQIPVLSEESEQRVHDERRTWPVFWLVDPLDGTKEFIKGNGEFTVNIALIEGDQPLLGVVHTPARSITHWAHQNGEAYKANENKAPQRLTVRSFNGGQATVVASRSHGRGALKVFLERLQSAEGKYEVISLGSALKVCLVAEGSADVYPRLGPTSEWDTAAAHCVLNVAGGKLIDTTGKELVYNKSDILNPWFLAIGAGGYDWTRYVPRDDEV